MVDPLAEVVTLLQPGARFSKAIVGAGPWQVRRSDAGQPFYCVVLEGGCRLVIDGHEAITLCSGDFVLIPAAYGVAMSSLAPPSEAAPENLPVALATGEFRIGDQDGPTDLRMLVGHCSFGSPDAGLLLSLLPQLVHVRGEPRLATLVQFVRDEFRERRPAREVILAHLLEVLLIEALRSTAGTPASPGLVRGLADERLAVAIRRMHESPASAWTVAQLAKDAALSRSAFFDRFSRAVGVAPMEYLLAWRMAVAKNMLRQNESGIAEIAERVGYGSASAFSVAFTRHVGVSPTHYAREQAPS
ncbi:AraC family transcriptional regulator [Bradyrhizobium sp. LTSP885]|uniref:AraC family transcriptional regulator n=1 Tax=Bradyrhizobium sp. LTSP885 TaxID=1619232 RepID=UPI0005C8F332|nr:AraC family transcriptional regulator [Bradyrhizobium sp. LTSP885]KJC49132.1 AraC family transcriptional regulator [Bradyrhizobium sp. LTSP885]